MENEYIEKVLFKGFMENKRIMLKMKNAYDADYFANVTVGQAFNLAVEQFDELGRMITYDMLQNALSDDIDIVELIDEVKGFDISAMADEAYILKHAEAHLKDMSMRSALNTSVDIINTGGDLHLIKESVDNVLTLNLSGGEVDKVLTPMTEWMTIEMEPLKYYMFPIVSEGSYTLLFGEKGCGKTMFALTLAHAISTGSNFGLWTHGSGDPVKTLYIDGEVYYKEMQERLDQFEPTEYLYVESKTKHENEERRMRFMLNDDIFKEWVKTQCLQNGIQFLVIDNLASLFIPESDNDVMSYAPLNQYFLHLRALGIATVIVHHSGKNKNVQRGTSGREDNVNQIIQLSKPQGHEAEDGLVCNVRFKKFRGAVNLENKHLIKSRTMSFQPVIQANGEVELTPKGFQKCEWKFSDVDLQQDANILIDLVNGVSQSVIAQNYEGLNQTAISRQVDEHIKQGRIERHGQGRGTTYEATDIGKEWCGDLWTTRHNVDDFEKEATDIEGELNQMIEDDKKAKGEIEPDGSDYESPIT